MYDEDDLLPIAALQHLAFCERQWGLMYLEQVWEENRLTAEGRVLHERVDESGTEVRDGLRIARGLRVRSLRYGLVGRMDIVEFHPVPDLIRDDSGDAVGTGVHLDGVPGRWRPFPVEFKHGRPKVDRCDEIQLCAQALCLEEMLDTVVAGGAIFYGLSHRRTDVVFDGALRDETIAHAVRLHELWHTGRTPRAKYEKKCRSCSLLAVCLPKATTTSRSVERYLMRAVTEASTAEEGGSP